MGFQGYVKKDTHCIGLVTGVIICWPTISCRDLLYDFPAFNEDLSSGMLNWKDGGVQVDSVSSRHIACSMRGLGNAFLREMMSHSFCGSNGLAKGPSSTSNGLKKGDDGPGKGPSLVSEGP